MDKAGETVKCAATDKACADKARAEGKTVVTSDAEEGGSSESSSAASASASGGSAAAADALKPGEGAWANYDFKPGDRILYADDFMGDEVGDFPRRMEFKEGAMEIVEWQGARWLRANSDSRWFIVLPEVLPDRFTMEFDMTTPDGEVWIWFGDDQNRRVEVGSGNGNATVYNGTVGVNAEGRINRGYEDRHKIYRARILGDGKYIKVYVGDKRILNVPNADLGRTNKISFWADASDQEPAMLANFRVAAGGKKLYDALSTAGRVATQGIYFDTGSDRIRPESSPTLKEIAQMLKDHAELKLTIEGHTDNVGSAASNQTLSEKRAAAVKAALVSSYGVDESRLASKGLGATKPATSNDTAEGRQSNRRVELVKM
jgi:outer membrane protein OmpA-like peptidoglycan-associated protein